jgi:hypothetical protein
MQYRLAVQFDNGKKHFSNTVSIRGRSATKPSLQSNVIRTGIATIIAPEQFGYSVYEYSGRLVKTGRGGKGVVPIDLSGIPKGFYLLQYSMGSDRFVEKFVKQ